MVGIEGSKQKNVNERICPHACDILLTTTSYFRSVAMVLVSMSDMAVCSSLFCCRIDILLWEMSSELKLNKLMTADKNTQDV